MAWVIKNKCNEYWCATRDTWCDCQRNAKRFATPMAAHESLSRWNHPQSFELNRPRIVRLKPRAKLDEAAIRRAERERIAAAVDEQGILITIAHRPVGQIAYLDNCTNGVLGAQALKSAILAFDWKPGAP